MRYLTKSKFKLGLECPTKLFYVDKSIFPNQKKEDPFLEQLANGGFQAEALARLKYAGGEMIDTRNRFDATKETETFLKNDSAIIYEASFIHKNLNVRADIVTKQGNYLKLIEVKAKSSRSSQSVTEDFLNAKSNKIYSGWEAYLWDIAFQTYVAKSTCSNYEVGAFLLLVDKDANASIDGIHQKFKITKGGADKRLNIKVEEGLDYNALGNELLVEKDVTEIVLKIIDGSLIHSNGLNFKDNLELLSNNYLEDKEIHAPIGKKCKGCEFKLNADDEKDSNKFSGFKRCWLHDGRVDFNNLDSPKPYDIYQSRFAEKVMNEQGVYLAKDLIEEQLSKPSDKSLGYNWFDRQSMQLADIKAKKTRVEINSEALEKYLSKINYPLNMIDFETCAMALPFTKGMSPYETIAFQFSHHIIHKDGRVEHATQWLKTDPYSFPNFDFVRALRDALMKNNGSIFRYHNHENTVLNKIKSQLQASSESDKDELIAFIESITSYSLELEGSKSEKVKGERCMIDLHRLINDCYYNTHFAHSLSLKVVLPAIIRMDLELQSKYCKAIAENKVGSLNFSPDHRWLKPELKDGLDPYHLLPKPFSGFDDEQLAAFINDAEDTVSNGGTAMMAYAQMQYTDMLQEEREALEYALLKYCETDTLAMVFVWEHILRLNDATSITNNFKEFD